MPRGAYIGMVPVHHFTVARSLNQGYLSGSDHPKKATYMNNSLPFNKMDQLGSMLVCLNSWCIVGQVLEGTFIKGLKPIVRMMQFN